MPVLMDVGNLSISPALQNLPFNPLTDFAPVAMVGYWPHLQVTSIKVPANTVAELIAWAKEQKGKANYAVAAGVGSATHLAGVVFATRAGIQWGNVPYKGGAQAITDLIGGQVDVTFNGMVATLPHVKSGTIKLSAEVLRIAALPDVRDRLTALGADPSPMSPVEFGAWLKAEVAAMAEIVEEDKITVE